MPARIWLTCKPVDLDSLIFTFQQLCTSGRILYCFFQLLQRKLLQPRTPPVSLQSNLQVSMVPLHLVFPFFVVFIGERAASEVTARLQQPLLLDLQPC